METYCKIGDSEQIHKDHSDTFLSTRHTFGSGTLASSARLWHNCRCLNWNGLFRRSSNDLMILSLIHSTWWQHQTPKTACNCHNFCHLKISPQLNCFARLILELFNEKSNLSRIICTIYKILTGSIKICQRAKVVWVYIL